MPLIPIADLAAAPVDHIVSLGSNCQVAHNLRRYFNFSTAYPFDWWISGASGVVKVLDGYETNDLYSPASLIFQAIGANDRAVVLNKDLGISFNHEFPRDRKQPGSPVLESYASHLPAAMERTDALTRRLFSLNRRGLRLLFVRRALRHEQADVNEYRALLETLSKRFSNVLFGLLMVNATLTKAQLGDAENLNIHSDRSFGWKGDPAAWDIGLAPLGITLSEGLHKPAKEHVSPHSPPEGGVTVAGEAKKSTRVPDASVFLAASASPFHR